MSFKYKLLFILLVVLFVKMEIITAVETTAEWDSAISRLPLSPDDNIELGTQDSRVAAVAPSESLSTSRLVPRPGAAIWIPPKTYYLGVHFRLNWFEAHLYCRRYNMQLVTLSTKQDHDAIINHLRNQGVPLARFWTSGVDLSEEGRYYWMSTGQLFRYTNWIPRQPDNNGGNEHCVELNRNQWSDSNCYTKNYFICEK